LLVVTSDGKSFVALTCQTCGARGPRIPLNGEEDKAPAEMRAVNLWSIRNGAKTRPQPATLERVRSAAALAAAMLGPDRAHAFAEIRLRDVQELLAAFDPTITGPN
jgi:hypothetical protein